MSAERIVVGRLSELEELLGGAILAEVLGLTFEDVGQMVERARELALAGLGDEAVTMLRGLVMLNPRDPAMWGALGEACERHGRLEDALGAYGRGAKVGGATHPNHAHQARLRGMRGIA